MKTFKKDYFISIVDDQVIITINPNAPVMSFVDLADTDNRYLYKIGDKVLTLFGVQTIKEIYKNFSSQPGHEWLILVEENGNQYKPCELIGIVINEVTREEAVKFIF